MRSIDFMGSQDYYNILGVSRKAGDDEIRRAYRRNAKKYHPDRNPDDKTAEAKFKQIQEAYDVLSDKQKKAQYDRFGKAGVGRVAGQDGRRYYTWGGGSSINLDELDDLFTAFGRGGRKSFGGASIFEQIFGSSGQRRGHDQGPASAAVRGRDIEHPINLTFDQALKGTQVDIDLVSTGRRPQERQTLAVKIPPIVQDGQRIRLAGKGHPGQNGGGPGDLYIICKIQPHPYFRRRGLDIFLDVPISVAEAILGAKIDVPTLEGVVTVTVPPGTQSGTRLRLKGLGMTASKGHSAGDQIVVIQIVTPKNLTDQQQQAVRQLARQWNDDPRSGLRWASMDDES